VGLPWANGIASGRAQPPWADARRACVLSLLRTGHFADWPTRIAHVDACCAMIEGDIERACFVFVAQAILVLRLRGDCDGRDKVKAELAAAGVSLGINDHALDAIIRDAKGRL
jgi:hypothetical protein